MSTFTNNDSALTQGSAVSQSCQLKASACSNPFVTKVGSPGTSLWRIFANPWAVTAVSGGTTTVNYNGAGNMIFTVNYTGINPTQGVNGSPLIRYGGDIFDTAPILGQGGLVFPVKISAMSSLIVDIAYSINNTSAPVNQDIGFDQWLIPDPHYSGGIPGAFEIFIMPYMNFGGLGSGGGASFVNNFNYDVNGAPKNWSLFSWGSGIGQEQIFCPQGAGQILSGELVFDMLPMLKQAIASAGGGVVTNEWYLANMDLGTEYGGSATVNYTATVSKLQFQQTFPDPAINVACSFDDQWLGGEVY